MDNEIADNDELKDMPSSIPLLFNKAVKHYVVLHKILLELIFDHESVNHEQVLSDFAELLEVEPGALQQYVNEENKQGLVSAVIAAQLTVQEVKKFIWDKWPGEVTRIVESSQFRDAMYQNSPLDALLIGGGYEYLKWLGPAVVYS